MNKIINLVIIIVLLIIGKNLYNLINIDKNKHR